MFFLNLVPPVCPDGDFFYDGKSIEHEYFARLFSEAGTPTVSAYPAFLQCPALANAARRGPRHRQCQPAEG